MAQRIEHLLIDDLTGEPAQETVSFGIDGASYVIDLTESNAAELRLVLGEYIEAARKASGVKRPVGERMSREEAQAIRSWAAQNGFQPAARGRIPTAVVEAYRAAA